jgi:hypothetical protein
MLLRLVEQCSRLLVHAVIVAIARFFALGEAPGIERGLSPPNPAGFRDDEEQL